MATPPGCPASENNLVDVTHLPVPVRWLLAIAVVCTSGFFAGGGGVGVGAAGRGAARQCGGAEGTAARPAPAPPAR